MIVAVLNHLWQSSVVVLAAALVAWALRQNRASARHAVWLAASLKFLLPFSLLIGLGGVFTWRTAAEPPVSVAPAIVDTVETITEPFAGPASLPVASDAAPHSAAIAWPAVLASLWIGGGLVVAVMRVRAWSRVRAALRASTAIDLPDVEPGVRVRATPGLLEPGIVGIWRPVLLVPVGLDASLSVDQMRAVVLHEMHHVRRRDNLTSALHMAVEIAFWFHPLVWWVGARLVDERERACDEHVIASGAAPDAYAEGILNVCKRYIESPAAFVAGVTGSDLKKRVGAILAQRVGVDLSISRKAAIAVAALVALVVPFAAGVVTAPARTSMFGQAAVPTPKLEVASVRPCAANEPGSGRGGPLADASPGRLHLNCYSVLRMIQTAYGDYADGRPHSQSEQPVLPVSDAASKSGMDHTGGQAVADWVSRDRFTIEAKAESDAPPIVMVGPVLQRVLEDRFKVKVHREMRDVPVYEMVAAKGGAKLTPAAPGACVPYDMSVSPQTPLGTGQHRCSNSNRRNGDGGYVYDYEAITLDEFAEAWSRGWIIDRPIVNKTGITGLFTMQVEQSGHATAQDEATAEMIGQFKNRLGLELRPGKGQREFLIIDHVEPPSPDGPQVSASTSPASVGPSASIQKFDVASIRPCAPEATPPGARGGGGGSGSFSPGRAHFDCFIVKNLIQTAYVNQRGVPAVGLSANVKAQDDPINNYPNLLRLLDPSSPQQVRGGPAWVYSDKYTIEAEAAGLDPTDGSGADRRTMVGPMLQALLEERFGLKLHRETEQAPMYALTIAKTGLKLKPIADADCNKERPVNGPPITMADALARGAKPTCGTILGGPHGGNWQYQIAGQDLAPFAHTLGSDLGVNVIDRTGVSDKFNFVWEYGPDENTPGVKRYFEMTGTTDSGPPTAPNVFAALRQLGLELEKIAGTRAYFVIDHIERPTFAAASAEATGGKPSASSRRGGGGQ